MATVLCSQGRVSGIQLHSSARAAQTGYRGVTYTRVHRRYWAWVYVAGYPAPAALGLAVLALLYHEHGKGALAALVASLTVMLFLVRNIFGAFLLFAVGAALYVVFLRGSATFQAAAVGVLAWTLLFGGTRSALKVLRARGQYGDAADLATTTGAPAELWAVLFVLLTTVPTGLAGWLTVTSWL